MANSIFLWPGSISAGGNITVGGIIFASDGAVGAPSYAFTSEPALGSYRFGSGRVGWSGTYSGASAALVLDLRGFPTVSLPTVGMFGWSSTTDAGGAVDLSLARDAANTLALRNGTSAQAFRTYGYISGSRFTYEAIQAVTTAVTLSGATSGTGNVIPAGATVVDIATSTTTTITGATGYQVGDGSDADRYGDITGTAVGTASAAANYTADPRWWSSAARAVTLTAKTSSFTGGVVQVTVFYMAATAA